MTIERAAEVIDALEPFALEVRDVQRGWLAKEIAKALSDAGLLAGGWRDIKDAPKDGTKFDAWCVHPEHGVHIGVRFTDVQMRGDGSGFGYIAHFGDRTVWQYLDARDEGAGFPAWNPIAWQPLPLPPAEE